MFFALNEQRRASWSASGETAFLDDLQAVEVHYRPIARCKPLFVKLPPAVKRSKPLAIELRWSRDGVLSSSPIADTVFRGSQLP
jgi:hypothetical protein